MAFFRRVPRSSLWLLMAAIWLVLTAARIHHGYGLHWHITEEDKFNTFVLRPSYFALSLVSFVRLRKQEQKAA